MLLKNVTPSETESLTQKVASPSGREEQTATQSPQNGSSPALKLVSFAPTATEPWRTLVEQYQALVNKEFTTGLTDAETQEMERLGAEIDAEEAPAFEHFRQTLEATLQQAKGE